MNKVLLAANPNVHYANIRLALLRTRNILETTINSLNATASLKILLAGFWT
jgi:hypothetical protein